MPRSDQSITTNVDRLELRRLRMAHSPPILRGGFRPFFLGTAMWALVALTLWLAILFGLVSPQLIEDPLAWHRHEMLFGFAGAAIARAAIARAMMRVGKTPPAANDLERGPPTAI
ncbi:MAG: NnrS family protein [Erythrobacter sp.]|nr:NnrS family protein [Erythrobacter sp.]